MGGVLKAKQQAKGFKLKDTSYVYEEIRERIVNRELLPGVKINQNQLALELGVSRTPVINALHMLKSGGLLDNSPNKGFYVHSASLQDTLELYELRQAVEMIAVGGVAEYADLEDIRACRDAFLPFLDQKHIDVAEYAKVDRMFHSRLIELSQNSMLQNVNQSVLLLSKLFSSGSMRSPKETLQGHLDIAEALLKRDGKLAKQLTHEHLGRSLNVVKSAVDRLREMGIDPRKIAVSDSILSNLHEEKE